LNKTIGKNPPSNETLESLEVLNKSPILSNKRENISNKRENLDHEDNPEDDPKHNTDVKGMYHNKVIECLQPKLV
jgi:hypothetical protein